MCGVKRVCDCCGSDRTLVGEGISEVRDFKGHSFALVGSCCASEIQRMLDKFCNKYGGFVDASGNLKASPHGTPTIRNIAHLREEIRESAHQ